MDANLTSLLRSEYTALIGRRDAGDVFGLGQDPIDRLCPIAMEGCGFLSQRSSSTSDIRRSPWVPVYPAHRRTVDTPSERCYQLSNK